MGQQAPLVLVLLVLLEYKDQQVQLVSLGLAELPEPLVRAYLVPLALQALLARQECKAPQGRAPQELPVLQELALQVPLVPPALRELASREQPAYRAPLELPEQPEQPELLG